MAKCFAPDDLSELTLGTPLGFLINDKDMFNYVEINDPFVPIIAVLINIPWVHHVLRTWPLSKVLPKKMDPAGFGKLMECGHIFRTS